MLTSWSSTIEETPNNINRVRHKITSARQLDNDEDDTIADYVPPPSEEELPSYKSKDDDVTEKINYMISLLEDQKDEKSGQVTEDLILYAFLGIFILFVLDVFVKHGKYSR